MENKKVKVTVNSIQDKKWKDKDFLVLLTSEGEVSCWKPEFFSILRAVQANKEPIEVELTKTAKGNWSVTGIEGINVSSPRSRVGAITAAMDRKEAGITKMVDRKENAIVEAAIRRDSAIFTNLCWEGFGGDKHSDMVKNAHKHWTEYFRDLYAN